MKCLICEADLDEVDYCPSCENYLVKEMVEPGMDGISQALEEPKPVYHTRVGPVATRAAAFEVYVNIHKADMAANHHEEFWELALEKRIEAMPPFIQETAGPEL